MKKNKNQNSSPKLSKNKKTLLILTTILACFVIIPMVVLLSITLLPTITIFFTQREDKTKIISVACFNIAGTFPFIFRLIDDFSIKTALNIGTNVSTLIIIYGIAGVGLILYNELPNLFSVVGEINAKTKLKTIDYKLEKMKEEWGEEIVINREVSTK